MKNILTQVKNTVATAFCFLSPVLITIAIAWIAIVLCWLYNPAQAGSGSVGVLGAAQRGQIIEITPQSHPEASTNNYNYSFTDLQGISSCWYYNGQDQECDNKFLRFPSYTGTAPLREVRIYLRWHLSYAGKFENLHPFFAWNDPIFLPTNPATGIPWGLNWYTWSWAKFENGAMVSLTGLPSVSIDDCKYGIIGPYDGFTNYQGTSGRTDITDWDQCLQPLYWTRSYSVIQSPWQLPSFVDPDGLVELNFKSGAFAQIEHPWGPAGISHEFITYWDVSIDKIQYRTY